MNLEMVPEITGEVCVMADLSLCGPEASRESLASEIAVNGDKSNSETNSVGEMGNFGSSCRELWVLPSVSIGKGDDFDSVPQTTGA